MYSAAKGKLRRRPHRRLAAIEQWSGRTVDSRENESLHCGLLLNCSTDLPKVGLGLLLSPQLIRYTSILSLWFINHFYLSE